MFSVQAVSLIAFYLEIPLRYPFRLGGSRTYICDYAPSVEPTSSDFTSISLPSSSSKPMEFPLFLEGQDTTRSAYAVFLLNKVCLLSHIISAIFFEKKDFFVLIDLMGLEIRWVNLFLLLTNHDNLLLLRTRSKNWKTVSISVPFPVRTHPCIGCMKY